MKAEKIDIGQSFGRWSVVGRAKSRTTPGGTVKPYWSCKCTCGNVAEVRSEHLRSGRSASCGCLHKEIASVTSFKHGGRHTLLYDVWTQLIQRCENPNNKAFKNYGARGIKVCAEWHEYESFLRDMGPTYQFGLSIDRQDNDGNYEPNNRRWVTTKVNCRNQQRTIRVEWLGASTTLRDLADLYDINLHTAYQRYRLKGWTLRQSLGLDSPPKVDRRPITEETRRRMSDARKRHWAIREAA